MPFPAVLNSLLVCIPFFIPSMTVPPALVLFSNQTKALYEVLLEESAKHIPYDSTRIKEAENHLKICPPAQRE